MASPFRTFSRVIVVDNIYIAAKSPDAPARKLATVLGRRPNIAVSHTGMVVGKFRPALLAPASFPAARPRRGSARRRRTAPSGDRPWRELGHFSMITSAK